MVERALHLSQFKLTNQTFMAKQSRQQQVEASYWCETHHYTRYCSMAVTDLMLGDFYSTPPPPQKTCLQLLSQSIFATKQLMRILNIESEELQLSAHCSLCCM